MLDLHVHHLGRIAYRDGLAWQYATANRVRSGSSPDTLGLLEHEPVYTMGARGGRANLLAAEEELSASGVEVVDVDRGGDITYHGPGQLVAYPILLLSRLGLGPSDYVHRLEDAIIAVLDRFAIAASADPRRPGVWVGGAKIAAVGVRCQRGVTRHGVAINVDLDLNPFAAIIPCGLAGAPVTTIAEQLRQPVTVAAAAEQFRFVFASSFGFEPSLGQPGQISPPPLPPQQAAAAE